MSWRAPWFSSRLCTNPWNNMVKNCSSVHQAHHRDENASLSAQLLLLFNCRLKTLSFQLNPKLFPCASHLLCETFRLKPQRQRLICLPHIRPLPLRWSKHCSQHVLTALTILLALLGACPTCLCFSWKMTSRAEQALPLGLRDASLCIPVIKTMAAAANFRSAGNCSSHRNGTQAQIKILG